MAPKRPVPLGWMLRVNDKAGQLFYCNIITGHFQLKKPKKPASLATKEKFSLSDEGPLRRIRPTRIKARHILIKHSLSDRTPLCRVLSEECTTRSENDAYNLAKVIRLEIITNKYTFEEAALEHSECSTAFRGGKMNNTFYKANHIAIIFKKVAFALEIGQISEPVETNTGFHIIQRTA